MYVTFISTFEKIAEEESRVKKALPYILGMAAGGVGSDILRRNLPQLKNPALKNTVKFGLPVAGAALTYAVLPKLQAQFQKDVFAGKPNLP